ncbi:MAG: helix-turn-helix domain-containing protein [Parahaliea sp.]
MSTQQGMTSEEIGEELGIARQKAGRWRQRYADHGIGGISQDASRPGRKPKISPRKVEWFNGCDQPS